MLAKDAKGYNKQPETRVAASSPEHVCDHVISDGTTLLLSSWSVSLIMTSVLARLTEKPFVIHAAGQEHLPHTLHQRKTLWF